MRPPARRCASTSIRSCSAPARLQQTSRARAGRASRFDSPVSEAVAVDAPRVLFPIYDPAEHGADLRTPRRAAAPVEGHFPPPRQPFAAPGHQVRERTQKPERAGQPVAVVAPASASAPAPAPAPASLPAPVPEPALTEASVSAPAPSGSEPDVDRQLSLLDPPDEMCVRDGVNGLLLSRRDLDEAVEDGLLQRDIATLLWKNWSARRPVIHVIDDPAPSPVEPGTAASEIDGNATEAPSDPPAHQTDVRAPRQRSRSSRWRRQPPST